MSYIQSFKGQQWLLPPSLEDLIPEDHVCFVVEDFLEEIDLSSFDQHYAGAGHPAYHPRIILKLIIMGVLDRIRSSRAVARNARENVVYIYLAEKLAPDFRTISDFRKANAQLIKDCFKHTVTIAKQEGMLDLSHLTTDGTKIKANAANRSVFTKEEVCFLKEFIDQELDEWAKKDSFEDSQFGNLRGSDQLPERSKKKIKKAEDDIVTNKADQEKKKGEIEAQKKVVGEIDKQLKSVE